MLEALSLPNILAETS